MADGYCFEVFKNEESAHRRKEFPDKSSTIVSEDVLWNAVRDKPMINEGTINVSGCCLGLWKISSQHGVVVGNDTYVPVTLSCSGKWTLGIHCNKVEWFRCWYEL